MVPRFLAISQCRLSQERAAETGGISEKAVRCPSAGSLALLWSFSGGSECKKSACKAGALGLILGWERSGEGNGYPLHYSSLENSKDRGAQSATLWAPKESDVIEQRTLSLSQQMKQPINQSTKHSLYLRPLAVWRSDNYFLFVDLMLEISSSNFTCCLFPNSTHH